MEEPQPTTAKTVDANWFEALEMCARFQVQTWLQTLLEEKVEVLLDSKRHERRGGADSSVGCRSDHGGPGRPSMG
jgi:hypothetical protein